MPFTKRKDGRDGRTFSLSRPGLEWSICEDRTGRCHSWVVSGQNVIGEGWAATFASPVFLQGRHDVLGQQQWPYASLFGLTQRRWGLRIGGGPYKSSSGPSRCRWALSGVVGPIALSGGLTCRPWALRVVVWPYMSSVGASRRRWAHRVVVCSPRGGPGVLPLFTLLALEEEWSV